MNIKINSNLNLIKFIYFIFFTWLVYLIVLYNLSDLVKGGNFSDGYKLGNDSPRYINGAKDILSFSFNNEKIFGYFIYKVFVAISFLFSNDLFFVVIIQCLMTGTSAFMIYKITSKISDKLSGLMAMIFFLFTPEIQMRNFYILTDILYINLIIFGTYFYFVKKNFYLTIIIFALVIFTRPHGIIFLLFIIFLFYKKYEYLLNKKSKFFIFFLMVFLLINQINFLSDYVERKIDTLASIYRYIIYEFEYYPIDFPNELNLIKNDKIGILEFLKLCLKYPVFFVKIFLIKLLFFLGRVRPYYSDIHNFYLIFTTFIFYFFSLISIFYFKVDRSFKYFFYFIIIATSISVVLTTPDWSSRFFLPILPFIHILSSVSMKQILFKLFK